MNGLLLVVIDRNGNRAELERHNLTRFQHLIDDFIRGNDNFPSWALFDNPRQVRTTDGQIEFTRAIIESHNWQVQS